MLYLYHLDRHSAVMAHDRLQKKHLQACKAGDRLVHLPAHCQLTYGDNTSPKLMSLIEKVPQELWGAKLALQVSPHLLFCSLGSRTLTPPHQKTHMGACTLQIFRLRARLHPFFFHFHTHTHTEKDGMLHHRCCREGVWARKASSDTTSATCRWACQAFRYSSHRML